MIDSVSRWVIVTSFSSSGNGTSGTERNRNVGEGWGDGYKDRQSEGYITWCLERERLLSNVEVMF